MIIVTGGAGFIGSNLIKALNSQGRNDILVVDDLTCGHKFKNLVDCDILDYCDKDRFLTDIQNQQEFPEFIDAIFHQGACSTTTEWNGKMMMDNNYHYSKTLLHYCVDRTIPFIYASSAAVYGMNTRFSETKENEKPINVYGYSKLLFDNYVRHLLPNVKSQVVGLRYFNVYGPREAHKDNMASVAWHNHQQLLAGGKVKLFKGSHGYADGEQLRDFIYVDDAVAVNLWFLNHAKQSSIFNVGTGRSQPFNDVAKAVLAFHDRGKLEYIPFPEHLQDHYQSYTQADISKLREAGYDAGFKTVEQGVAAYLRQIT